MDKENKEILETDQFFEERQIISDKGQQAVRLDLFLMDRLENKMSRTRVQNAIKIGLVTVDGKNVKPNYKLISKHIIDLRIPRNREGVSEIVPEDIPLDIRYEDDDVIVLHKPAGLVVHPGIGNHNGTLVNGIAYYLQNKSLPVLAGNQADRPGLVHRIDKNTSGLMVLAKNDNAINQLAAQFAAHTVGREYRALVWGTFDEQHGSVNAHIGRNPKSRTQMFVFPEGDQGKHAITHYEVLEDMYYVSLIKCVLETGRTHQIRVHMKHLGHPLFNDEKYSGNRIVKGTVFNKYRQFVNNCFKILPRHALHAKTLSFDHPTTGERMQFESDLPADFLELLDKWRHYLEHRKSIN